MTAGTMQHLAFNVDSLDDLLATPHAVEAFAAPSLIQALLDFEAA